MEDVWSNVQLGRFCRQTVLYVVQLYIVQCISAMKKKHCRNRSLSDCHYLTLNVMFRVSQSVRKSQLCY